MRYLAMFILLPTLICAAAFEQKKEVVTFPEVVEHCLKQCHELYQACFTACTDAKLCVFCTQKFSTCSDSCMKLGNNRAIHRKAQQSDRQQVVDE